MRVPEITFHCIKVTQPIGTFYIGAIDAHDLHEIAFADVRRIEDRDVEKYLGIQRELNSPRVKEQLLELQGECNRAILIVRARRRSLGRSATTQRTD